MEIFFTFIKLPNNNILNRETIQHNVVRCRILKSRLPSTTTFLDRAAVMLKNNGLSWAKRFNQVTMCHSHEPLLTTLLI